MLELNNIYNMDCVEGLKQLDDKVSISDVDGKIIFFKL